MVVTEMPNVLSSISIDGECVDALASIKVGVKSYIPFHGSNVFKE